MDIIKNIILLVGASILVLQSAMGAIIYVSSSGVPDGQGTSWATAFTNLAEALDTASDTDSIFMAKGLFMLPSGEQVIIDGGIKLFGGFNGNEVFLDERVPGENETIIKASGLYSRLVIENLIVPSILDRITFTGGTAEFNPDFDDPCWDFSTNCYGGILYIKSESTAGDFILDIFDCTFKDNYAFVGGAIGVITWKDTKNEITFRSCRFLNNTAFIEGGGIFFSLDSNQYLSLVIDSCYFFDNYESSQGGGGLSLNLSGYNKDSITIQNSTFEMNRGLGLGGSGLQIRSWDKLPDIPVIIRNSKFLSNYFLGSFKSSARGGSAIRFRSSVLIESCLFDKNRCVGGGVINGPDMDIINSSFTNNYSTSNGGVIRIGMGSEFVINDHTTNSFRNCLFANNQTDTTGTVFYHRYPPSHDTIINCVFYNNSSNLHPAIFYSQLGSILGNTLFISNVGGDLDPQIFYYDESFPLASFNGDTSLWYIGNPDFVDTLAGDFRHKRCSPFINKGNNDYVFWNYDLNGVSRILEDTVDLGPFETLQFDPAIDILVSTCAHDPNGALIVADEGISPPALWMIHDDLDTFYINGQIPGGNYTATMIDQEECNVALNVTIEEPDSIQAVFNITPSPVNQGLGKIEIIDIYGGLPDYTITWINGSSELSLNKLYAGTYSVTITDNLNCQRIWLIEVPLLTNTESSAQMLAFKYSNPSSNPIQYYINGVGQQNIYYRLLSMVGNMHQEGQLSYGQGTILVKSFPSGIYWLEISADGFIKNYPIFLVD
jgi:hypothetical protein